MNSTLLLSPVVFSFVVASSVLAACSAADDGALPEEGPTCDGETCEPGHACIDYVTDNSTGTQCRTLEGTGCAYDDCKCAASEMCEGEPGTCEVVGGGVHISDCFWAP